MPCAGGIGILSCLPRTEHHKLTRRFWWLNGADSNQMQTFLLYTAEYQHYKELVMQALAKLEEERQEKLKRVGEGMYTVYAKNMGMG
jgi:hypothetical protein